MSKPCEAFSKETKKLMLKRLLRIVVWWLVIDVINHLFYFTALQKNHDIMLKLELWQIAGIVLFIIR